ncbi:aminoglycoside phosphotransferase family protein [Streptomyces tubbatahanensis]|uniref:Aminoglycoside phosphotransferase family protein n=1 Tax=Streptomyces tubbatahanensis TaxID=2923272 RepID=A0ABY3XWU3_9ACTN|nr:aminoglycoside phosphotransferase family protein [Streptomyces tubbatahanensis]UNS98974.1 aminoglycoside phosphotransferase family protein [Streptomyces tubbatahanensis]
MAAEFTAESAGAVLTEACHSAGLDATGAELLRLGSNAVYRLASAPVVVRIARDSDALESMQRAVGVARWLETEDFPATRVVAGVEQPALIGGRVVTYWENAQDGEEYARLDELADLLRRLHWLEEPESLRLPYFDPVAKVRDGLRALDVVTDDDRVFLEARAERLSKEYDRLDFVLPFGMIHGDANVGNALRDRDGQAILIDLDGFALAPREWDLVLTSLYYERFGWHTRAEYESFVHHYGFDLMNWPGYPVLADVRELMMTLWLGQQVTTNERAAEEFPRRVQDIRTGGSRRDWQPF